MRKGYRNDAIMRFGVDTVRRWRLAGEGIATIAKRVGLKDMKHCSKLLRRHGMPGGLHGHNRTNPGFEMYPPCRHCGERLPVAWRLWSKVAAREPHLCWLWTGATNWGGYPKMRAPGRHGKMLQPYREIWEAHHGPIPEGFCVVHECRHPACCNPAHLMLRQRADMHYAKPAAEYREPKQIPMECNAGHPMRETGRFYITPQGHVRCRECQNARHRSWKRSARGKRYARRLAKKRRRALAVVE